MTKQEMLEKYSQSSAGNNYREAQKRIREAMENGEKYVYLPGKNGSGSFTWKATPETIERLREDGFEIDETWNPYEYWSVEWYKA